MPDNPVPSEWTVLSMLEWGTDYLKNKNIPQPRLSMEWLLSETLGCKRLDLYLKYDRPLASEELAVLKPLILRRATHEPLQYITGSTDFYGLPIHVNPSVLIPRPETEQLVELVLDSETENLPKSGLDIGTGSGCIAIALKYKRPGWSVSATDISSESLKTAKQNADLNGTEIRFLQDDFLNPVPVHFPADSLDFIVSNPPYIPESEKSEIEQQVREFEPARALFHPDIKSVYQGLLEFARSTLKPGGSLYLEIHENYGEEIRSVFDIPGWNTIVKSDYSGKNRFIVARLI